MIRWLDTCAKTIRLEPPSYLPAHHSSLTTRPGTLWMHMAPHLGLRVALNSTPNGSVRRSLEGQHIGIVKKMPNVQMDKPHKKHASIIKLNHLTTPISSHQLHNGEQHPNSWRNDKSPVLSDSDGASLRSPIRVSEPQWTQGYLNSWQQCWGDVPPYW